MISRRNLLWFLAGGLLGPILPRPSPARSAGHTYLSARADAGGGYRVSGFSAGAGQAFDLPIPARGHSFAVHSGKRIAAHFARRPGRFARAIDLRRGAVVSEFTAPDDRHFCGHGVFSRDGRLLYASENDFNGERGIVGIYDAKNEYGRIGEFSSHGVGPHDMRLLSDGRTLVVANGGILTRPDLPGVKLNLPTMAPSLCYVDRRDGRLLQAFQLAPALHQLSIRHLAVGVDDTVAVAMQYEGPSGDLVSLVAVHRRGGPLRLLQGPPDVVRAMKQYCGSVCFDLSSRVIAVSAPRGNLITFWDPRAGGYISSVRVVDGSGVAPGERRGEFLASSGRGGVHVVDARSSAARPLNNDFLHTGYWDNHLVAVAT